MKDPPSATYSRRTVEESADNCFREFYHTWKDHGLSIRFDQDSQIERVLLYSGRTDKYGPYTGDLPGGILFRDAMPQVEKKLGKPEDVTAGRQDRVRCCWSYPSKGLYVEFDTYDIDDRKAPISHLGVFKPEDKDKK